MIAAPEVRPHRLHHEAAQRRHFVVDPNHLLMTAGDARREYDGLNTPGEVVMALGLFATGQQGSERTWIVLRPPLGLAPDLVIRLLPVIDGPSRRPRVDEEGATDLFASEAVTFEQLQSTAAGAAPSEEFPKLSEYDAPGNGVLWLDTRGAIGVDMRADDPLVMVRRPL